MEKEKKSHGVQLLIQCVVKDPDGKIVTDTGQAPSKSFVIQFLEFLYLVFKPGALTAKTDTTGAAGYIYYNLIPSVPPRAALSVVADVNDDTHGIVIGTGDTAEDNENHKLETQLTEGVGVGNITHGELEIVPTDVVGGNVDLVLKRAFTNNTGVAIGAKEVGIYSNWKNTLDPFDVYHCIVRDVLGAPVNIPDRYSLTIIYTYRTTV